MSVRRALAPMLLLAVAYAAAPYVTLWRLAMAMQHGDTAALERLVDWNSVRDGLKSDISEGVMGVHRHGDETADAGDTLPPFGASFEAGIASTVVDHAVTAERLVSTIRAMPAVQDERPAPPGVLHAFFAGPTSFDIAVRCPGQDADDEPLRLRLAISDGVWKVVRAWVPQDLVDDADTRVADART